MGMRLWVWLGVFLGAGGWDRAWTADPVFSPEEVTDSYGNQAWANSSVTWAPVPAGKPYKAEDVTYKDGGLGPLFNAARGFINIVQPNDFPVDLILGIINKTVQISSNYMELVMYGLGFAICFVIGILFFLLMPLIGCCFCCCRCCGNCGGKMLQRYDNSAECKRITFSICLFVCSVFLACGAACTFLTSDRMTVAVEEIGSTVGTNMDDLVTFMSNTYEEMEYVSLKNFEFTSDVIGRDLDNMGYLVGIPVRDTLGASGGVDRAVDAIIALETVVNSAGDDLYAVNRSIAAIKESGKTLQSDLDAVKVKITEAQSLTVCSPACSLIDTSQLNMEVDFDSLPDISDEVKQMEDVRSQSLADRAREGKEEFNDIPNRVTQETQGTITNIKDLLDSFVTTVEDTLANIDVLTTVSTEINKYRDQIEDMQVLVAPYDKYRWYGNLALACISFLIVALQLFGLLLGLCGHSKDALPTQRGCLSHSGGNMLMAAVGFVFIFSWFLMFLTSFSFLIGGNLEKIMCQPLTDPNFKIIKKILDEPGGMWNDYFLGKALLNNGSIPLTFSGLLTACKANSPAFTALKLGSRFNLDTVTNYKDTIDIDSELDNIDVDLSTVSILTDETEQQLADFSSSIDLDYDGFKSELSKNTTQTNLGDFADAIRLAASDSSGPAKAKLLEAADDLDTVEAGSYTDVTNAQTALYDNIVNLETSVNTVPASVDNTILTAKAVESYLQSNGSALIKEEAKKFANRILGIADSFADNVLNKVQSEIGRCKPVWNLWYSLIDVSFCSYIIDSFNGFWFSLGWCIFFMVPSIIFDVKLAKHFRKMKYVEGFDDVTEEYGAKPYPSPPNTKIVHASPPPPYYKEVRSVSPPPPPFTSNKVGHKDSIQVQEKF